MGLSVTLARGIILCYSTEGVHRKGMHMFPSSPLRSLLAMFLRATFPLTVDWLDSGIVDAPPQARIRALCRQCVYSTGPHGGVMQAARNSHKCLNGLDEA